MINYMAFVAHAMQAAYMERREELRRREDLIASKRESLPPDEFEVWLAKFEREIERQEDRKFQKQLNDDMCEAIESTSFWRFGRSRR